MRTRRIKHGVKQMAGVGPGASNLAAVAFKDETAHSLLVGGHQRARNRAPLETSTKLSRLEEKKPAPPLEPLKVEYA